jgi:hypothetical protein
MSEPTPLSLSHHFTQLIGRKVTFAPTTIAPETKIKQMYGIYNVLPHETAIVVKADLPLLGSLAGVMVGLPDFGGQGMPHEKPSRGTAPRCNPRGFKRSFRCGYQRRPGRVRKDGDRYRLDRWRCGTAIQKAGSPDLFQCPGGWLPGWKIYAIRSVHTGLS